MGPFSMARATWQQGQSRGDTDVRARVDAKAVMVSSRVVVRRTWDGDPACAVCSVHVAWRPYGTEVPYTSYTALSLSSLTQLLWSIEVEFFLTHRQVTHV